MNNLPYSIIYMSRGTMGPSGTSGIPAIANLSRVYSDVDHSPKEPREGERGVTEYLVFHVWSREPV